MKNGLDVALADGERLADAIPPGRHIPGSTTWNVVQLVRQRAGEEGVRRLLELAGEDRTAAELEDDATWSSFWQGKALFEAAVRVLGDPQALRTVGEVIARSDMTSEVAALLRSLGSPGEVLRHIGQAAAKFCTVVVMDAVEIGPEDAVVSAVSVAGFPRYELLCDLTVGLLSQVSIPFGLPPATVLEQECERRGDPRCLFLVTWDSEERSDSPTLDGELAMLAGRFETFQSTAAELVSASDVETVLARITGRAALAVRAPRHLLAVRPTAESELAVHHQGFTDVEADRAATALMVEDCDEVDGSRLVVDVASARRHYGRLAAFSDSGQLFFPAEQRLLSSYAGLAAAALDAATTLDESRAQAETARALLDLAKALANVGSVDEVAQRLAAAVPAVVDCEVSQVWIWDAGDRSIRMLGSHGLPDDARAFLGSLWVRPDDTPVLGRLLERPEGLFIDADTDDPFLAGLLDAAGMVAMAVVPIVATGQFFGVVTAGVLSAGRPMVAARLVDRLEGLADLAATAVQNAHLVDRIRHQALYDPITSLPNKRLLEDRMTQALEGLARDGRGFGLCFLDLDRFKNVNDTLGHDIGDELLGNVARRLVETVRREDTVARLGGDEFAVLIAHVDTPEAATAVAQKIYAALQEPFLVADHQLFITSSIGIAVAPLHGDDYAGLLKRADVAMYRAKQEGRNRYTTYSPALSESLSNRLRLEGDLHKAVAGGDQLVAYYQPIVELAEQSVVGVEALVRWQHPELGLLTPNDFLSLAEETGLIVAIDFAVLRSACWAARRWAEAGFAGLSVSVNVSDRALRDPSLPDVVVDALGECGLEARQLRMEVTERVIDVDTGQGLEALNRLRGLGVSLAIDDFGTGNSGFSRLRDCPVDSLKLDKSFVQEVETAGDEAPLLAGMIRLAHDLHLSVVGEGVETSAQRDFLRRHDCELAQGYFFSRPMPQAGISDLLAYSR